LVGFNPEIFMSESLRKAFSLIEKDLMYTNVPEASVLLYRYTNPDSDSDYIRNKNTLVGSAGVYQDMDGTLFIRIRLSDEAMPGENVRKVELWSSCDKDGSKLKTEEYGGSEFKTTEDLVSFKLQDICHMTHGLDKPFIDKIKDIRGHDSVAALRVASKDGSRFACGYLKQPEAAFLNWKQFHSDQPMEGGLLFLSDEQPELLDSPVIVITGGYPDPNTVEAVKLDGTLYCKMANLPDNRRFHSIDGGFLCGGVETKKSCLQYRSGGWSTLGDILINERRNHVSWRSPKGLMLMGGNDIDTGAVQTSEIVTTAGSKKGFALEYETIAACGFQHDENFIITGGMKTKKKVSKYNVEGFVEDLPDLETGRFYHACGYYTNTENKPIYLVTGGSDNENNFLASTEILSDPSGSWKTVAELPSSRTRLAGVSLANKIFVIGGNDGSNIDDILVYDPSSDKWLKIGKTQSKRHESAVSLLPLAKAKKLCV